MLVTITIMLALGVSILTYLVFDYRKKYEEAITKYKSSIAFANEAATRILDLEYDKASLSNTVRSLTPEIVNAKRKTPKQKQPVNSMKATPKSVEHSKTAAPVQGNKRGPKPKNKQQ